MILRLFYGVFCACVNRLHQAVFPPQKTAWARGMASRRQAARLIRPTLRLPALIVFFHRRVGGYEHTFVDKIAAKYYCNICFRVLRDARLTVCCGQHYCASCLEQWSDFEAQKEKKTCPYCRKEQDENGGFQHVPNKSVIREINEFHVKCSNHSKGCGWVGELGDLEKHIKSENGCGYEMVKCNYSGYRIIPSYQVGGHSDRKDITCHHLCQRQSLAAHQRMCKWRQYKCEYCGKADTYDAIAGEGKMLVSELPYSVKIVNHYYICKQYPLECSNKCGEKAIKRRDIQRHREQCPLEPLPCPFKNVGCSSVIPRCDMDSHCQTNMQNHLLMMAKSHDELLHKNNELFSKKDELFRKNEELFRKNEELHRKNEELTKRVTALEKRKK